MLKSSLYDELVPWYPLLDPVEEHEDEVAAYDALLASAVRGRYQTLLELGAGAGNNGFYFRRQRTCTLTDVSTKMLALSKAKNPDCVHHEGDMRDLRLGVEFDAVFVHDAIVYMRTEEELERAARTAFAHTRPGGAALFVPDLVRDGFREFHEDDANDDDAGRGLRYVAWVTDPDPDDSTCRVDYAFLLRDENGVRAAHDSHEEGLFTKAAWTRILSQVGFDVALEKRELDDEEQLPYCDVVFLCRRPE